MVEFLFVFMLVALLFFAMIDFGMMMNSRLVLMAACRDGARRAAIEGGASAAIEERVQDQIRLGFLDPSRATVAITPHTANYGTPVTVSVSYPYRFITPLIRGLFGGELTLKASVTVRSEHVR